MTRKARPGRKSKGSMPKPRVPPPAQAAAPTVPSGSKPANITFPLPKDDTETLPLLDLVTQVYYARGLIPKASRALTFRYLVKHFGEAERAPPSNGSLPLDAERRKELIDLRKILTWGGDLKEDQQGDVDVINVLLDMNYRMFTPQYIQLYLVSRGKIKET